ncbi:unnamed protein product [Polarella glacialis]|uniref:Uncharacterized protein n=1 Tax=Polarella glacialis TaxID=89957 RepID=A0A813HV33_POLGL|nr:unnamed protein product [Polarella glacialis]
MVPEDDNPMGARIGSIICFRLLPDQTSPTATGIVINGFEGEEEVRERITKPLATVGARDRPPLFVAPPPRASASIGQSSKGDKGGKGKKGFTTGEKGGKNGISWKGDKGGGKGQMGKGIRNKGNGSAPWSR